MKLRVFIIDDEDCIVDTLRRFPVEQGPEVITAKEPLYCDIQHECDCSAPSPCGDILLVDQEMPRMKGLDFIDFMHKRAAKEIRLINM